MKTNSSSNTSNINSPQCALEKSFINYFSMGYEASVGFGKNSSY